MPDGLLTERNVMSLVQLKMDDEAPNDIGPHLVFLTNQVHNLVWLLGKLLGRMK